LHTRSHVSSADLAVAVSACISEGMCTLALDDEVEMAEIAEMLKVHDSDHRLLVAREREDARASTLSGRYGMAAFPWHTDGAHQTQPPRLSLMRSRAPTGTPTLLLDAHSLLALVPTLADQLRRQTWLVDGGARPFYASIVDRAGRVRFNRHVMTPTSAMAGEAELAFQALIEDAEPVEHAWEADELLLLDNTRIVHARPPIGENDANRELERLLCALPSRLGR
jgi:alpha-ketoglutarate-dependent taurine dioxygenase